MLLITSMSILRMNHEEEEPFVDRSPVKASLEPKLEGCLLIRKKQGLVAMALVISTVAVLCSLLINYDALSSFRARFKKSTILKAHPIDHPQIPPPHFPWQYAETDSERYPGLIENLVEKTRFSLLREENRLSVPDRDPSLYMIRAGILWAPSEQQTQRQTESWLSLYYGRISPFEQMIAMALEIMKVVVATDKKNGSNIFPERWRKFLHGTNLSVPLFFNPRDEIQIGCKQPKPVPSPSLFPMFGLAMNVSTKVYESLDSNGCEVMPFAVPGYEFWNGLKHEDYERSSPTDWGSNESTPPDDYQPKFSVYNMTFGEMAVQYPWYNKTQKAIWRGSTTGPFGVKWQELPRSKLVQLSKDHEDLLDAAYTNIAHGWNGQQEIVDEIHRDSKVADYIPPTDFMNYKAIVDIDGNSWSSRFGMLLCTNSVVIKIAPGSVDYWHGELKPWAHYVPAHSNLTDLVDRVRYVIDPRNDEAMRTIVRNANEWCRTKMTTTQLAIDMLWILGGYLDALQVAAGTGGAEEVLSEWHDTPERLGFEQIELHKV